MLLIGAVAVVVYAGAVPSGFAFDDRSILQTNPVIQGTVPLREAFLRDWWGASAAQTVGSYRPIALMSLWCDWRLGGWFKQIAGPWLDRQAGGWTGDHGGDPRAWPMHLVNVCLHALAMMLLYRVLRRIVSERTAFAAVLLCAVVAAPSEVVDGLAGRADLLETIGVVGGLWAHRRLGSAAAALASVCLLLALGSKETGIMAVAAWALMDLWLPDPASPPRRRVGRYAGYGMIFVGYLLLRRGAIGTLALPRTQHDFYNPLLSASFGGRIFGAGRIFAERYLLGILDPRRRLYDCSAQACGVSDARDPMAWLGVLLFVLLLVLPFALRRRLPAAAAGFGWWAVFFAPVSNFLVPATLTYGERLLYVPMIGLAIAIVDLAGRAPRGGWTSLAAVGAFNAALLQFRHPDWRSNATLAASGLRYAASSVIVQENNASAAVDRRDYAAAEAFGRRATELVPEDAYAHKILGVAYFYEGRAGEAGAEFRRAIALEPTVDLVRDYASFLALEGRYPEALTLVREQERKRPAEPALGELEARLLRALGHHPERLK
jgi:hypothetical protein